jgi:hypothetical protein
MAVNGVEPTINLRLAQAYSSVPTRLGPTPTGPNQTGPIRFKLNATQPAAAQPLSAKPIGAPAQASPIRGGLSIKAASLLVHQQLDSFARTAIAPKVSRVVAAQVPGTIDFSAKTPRQVGPALQLYRHPADRNDAATRVNLGGLIDVDG